MTTLRRRIGPSLLPIFFLAATACTSWQRVGGTNGVAPEESLVELFNPGGLYRSLGRLVSTGDVPFIGSVAQLPGVGDSTAVMVGVSLGNRAFSFNRLGDIYQARYRVEYVVAQTGKSPISIRQDDVIQVATLDEATRTDESVLLQQELMVAPGRYDLTVRVTDLESSESGLAVDSLIVSSFGDGSTTAPILVYEAAGRGQRNEPLDLLLNPRGAIAYGADTFLVYIEGVGYDRPTTVPLQVRDQMDVPVLTTEVQFEGTGGVESRAIRVAPDSVPLGQLQVVLGNDDNFQSTSGLVSFSGNWIITNFDALLSLLRYFPHQDMIGDMRDADDLGRSELWPKFFRETDPNQQTPENELLDLYFGRLALANARYQDEGIPGWRTDRGEVFVVLGPPDEIFNATATGQGRFIRWAYGISRLELFFEDATGFGRYRMTTQSRSDFERVRARSERGL